MPDDSHHASSTVKYRCVCGQDALVHLSEGGKCDSCGRDISAEMLRSNVSQTIDIPGSGVVAAATGAVAGSTVPGAQISDEDFTGQTFGHYRIVGALGHGGMGSVYRALDESLQRYVALKVIKKVGTTSSELDRLMQEARAQARVNHPNVVHIYYVSRDEERPFLAMELVNGPTLAARVREGKLPYAEVVLIGIETARALNQSARFDIVHGDIKPSNILLDDNQLVKLSDFGLARRISHGTGEPTKISGTPAYMAPEVTRGADPSVLSDQYSLGVMLFQMTFGRSPYAIGHDSVTAMMEAHQQAPVEFPKPWPQDLPDEWRHILAKLLAKDPEDRYADYDALIQALQNARPLNLTPAGIVIRSMAWTGDLLIVLGVLGLLQLPLQIGSVESIFSRRPLSNALGSLIVFIAPLLAAFVQARWRTTPAKKMLQIRIVDEHGLKPGRAKLAARSVSQFLPVWAAALFSYIERLGGETSLMNNIFSIVYGIFLIVSVATIIFSKHKRAPHDMALDTRVCLDAGASL